MENSDWNDSISFEAETYKDQSYEKRVENGLTIDRSYDHSEVYWNMNFFAMMRKKTPPDPMFMLKGLYRTRRKNDWNTKRWANAKMVNLKNVNKQMDELFMAILIDVLSDDTPTSKDWKSISEKNEKQIRRTEENYQHMVCRPGGGIKLMIREKDGSFTTYPKRIVRDGVKDARIAEIATAYSYPTISSTSFDPRVFVDDAYLKREIRFWNNALRVLSRWLEDGNRIREQKAWLPYHIVNNDIGMHVLFENISVEVELRWLKTLDTKSQLDLCNGGIRFFDIDGDKYYGGTIPDPYGPDNAKKAINEYESFLVDFKKNVPENLCQFMIPQNVMKKRIWEHVLEGATRLKPYQGRLTSIADLFYPQTATMAGDWEHVCVALASSNIQ
ncbi:MAG: hypothetical protein OXC46_01455 [Thaumarchaeota archaeon]|nr:hypothetical protein [Nitrososphaerota archaeon]